MTSNTNQPIPPEQAAATSIIAILFFFITVLEGSPRILRVIDSRRQIVVRRTAQYFATQNYNTQQQHQPQTPKSQSNLGSGNNNSGTNTPRRTSSMGSAAQRQAGNLELPSLLTDNRFILGVVAATVGVLRSAYVLSVLMMNQTGSSSDQSTTESPSLMSSSSSSSFSDHNAQNRHCRYVDPFHNSMFVSASASSKSPPTDVLAGETVVSDLITAPLAVLSYSLVLAVLFAHRELMTKIRKAYDPNPPPSDHPEFPRNPSPSSVVPPVVVVARRSSATNLNTHSSTNSNAASSSSQGNLSRTESPGTAINTNQNGSSGSAVASSATFAIDPNPLIPPPVESSSSSCLESDFYQKFVRPYRTLLSIAFVALILAAAFVIEAVTQDVNVIEICSPAVSILLGIWSFYSTVESYVRLRFFGAASRRVIVAILILTIYLLVRGIIILPPIQEKLCATNNDDESGGNNYWRCFFPYMIVDSLGMLISLLVLP